MYSKHLPLQVTYLLNESLAQNGRKRFPLHRRLLRVQMTHDAMSNITLHLMLCASREIQHLEQLILVMTFYRCVKVVGILISSLMARNSLAFFLRTLKGKCLQFDSQSQENTSRAQKLHNSQTRVKNLMDPHPEPGKHILKSKWNI